MLELRNGVRHAESTQDDGSYRIDVVDLAVPFSTIFRQCVKRAAFYFRPAVSF